MKACENFKWIDRKEIKFSYSERGWSYVQLWWKYESNKKFNTTVNSGQIPKLVGKIFEPVIDDCYKLD